MEINENGKFLVGFRNYNKDKQVSLIICENSINHSIVNESLISSFIKVDLDITIIDKGWVVLAKNKSKTQHLCFNNSTTLNIFIHKPWGGSGICITNYFSRCFGHFNNGFILSCRNFEEGMRSESIVA